MFTSREERRRSPRAGAGTLAWLLAVVSLTGSAGCQDPVAFEGKTPIAVQIPGETEEPEEPALPPPTAPAAAPFVSNVRVYSNGVLTLLSSGPTQGGQRVRITGGNFSEGEVTVRFATANCTDVVFIDSTRLECTTPARPAGAVRVTVRNADGQVGFRDAAYTYTTALYLAPLIKPTIAQTNEYVVAATGGVPPYTYTLVGPVGGVGEQLTPLADGTARYTAPNTGGGTGTVTIQVTDSGGSPAATAEINVVAYPALATPFRATEHSEENCLIFTAFPGRLIGGQSLCFNISGGVGPFTLEAESPGYGEFRDEEVTTTGRFDVYETSTTGSVRIRAKDSMGNVTAWETLSFYPPITIKENKGHYNPVDKSRLYIAQSCNDASYFDLRVSGGVVTDPSTNYFFTAALGSFGDFNDNPNLTYSPPAFTGTDEITVYDLEGNAAKIKVTVVPGQIAYTENLAHVASTGNTFSVADGNPITLQRNAGSGGVPPFKFSNGSNLWPTTPLTLDGYEIDLVGGTVRANVKNWDATAGQTAPPTDVITVRDGCGHDTVVLVRSFDEPAFTSFPTYIKGGNPAKYVVSNQLNVGYEAKTCTIGATTITPQGGKCVYDTPIVSATQTRTMTVRDEFGQFRSETLHIRGPRRISSYNNLIAVAPGGKLCLRSNGGGGVIQWSLVAGPGTVNKINDVYTDGTKTYATNSKILCGIPFDWEANTEGEKGSVAVYEAPTFGSFAVVRASDRDDPDDFADFAISIVSPNSSGDANPDPDKEYIEEDFEDIADTNTAQDGRFWARGAAIDRFSNPGKHRVVTLGYSKSDVSTASSGEEIILMRYNADEHFQNGYVYRDSSFGTGGMVRISTSSFGLGGNNRIQILNSASASHYTDSTDTDSDSIVQSGSLIVYNHPDQGVKYLVAGAHYNGANWDGLLVQFTSNGEKDINFGFNGVVTVNVGSSDDKFFSVAVQTDSNGKPTRILAAGRSGTGVLLTGHLLDGTLDPSFDGGDGKIVYGTPADFSNVVATGIAVPPGSDATIVYGGYGTHSGNAVSTSFRLNYNGSSYTLDSSWASGCGGSGGFGVYSSAYNGDYAYAIHRSNGGSYYFLSGLAMSDAGFIFGLWRQINASTGCSENYQTGAAAEEITPSNEEYTRPIYFGGSVRTPDDTVATQIGPYFLDYLYQLFHAVTISGTETESETSYSTPIRRVWPGGMACVKCLTPAQSSGWLFHQFSGKKDPDPDPNNDNDYYFQGVGKRSRF